MEIIHQINRIINTIEKLNKALLSSEIDEELTDSKQKIDAINHIQKKIQSILAKINASNPEDIDQQNVFISELYWLHRDFADSIDFSSLVSKALTHYRALLPKKVSLLDSHFRIKIDKEIVIKDSYCLILVRDYIVVNDAHKGLIIFDKQLHEVRKIPIIPRLIIEEFFTHPTDNELVLYSSESRCFIWVNVELGDFVIIDFAEQPVEYPKKICIWSNNTLIFGSRDNNFYALDVVKKTIKNISATTIKKRYPSFFQTISYCNTYHPKALVFNKPVVIFNSEQRQEGTIVDILTQSEVAFPYDNDFYCFAHYHGHYKYMVICEYSISFINEEGFYIGKVDSDRYTEFLHTYYFEDNGFITLIYNYDEGKNRDTIIRIYRF